MFHVEQPIWLYRCSTRPAAKPPSPLTSPSPARGEGRGEGTRAKGATRKKPQAKPAPSDWPWPERATTQPAEPSASREFALCANLRRLRLCQRLCKPGSVPFQAATIHLGCVSPRTSSNQPAHPGRIRPASRHDAPIRSCSRWGLPCRACYQPRGALLPHPFDLAGNLSVRPAVCFLWHCPWGHPRRALPATVDPWSPDFPRPLRDAAAQASGTAFTCAQGMKRSRLQASYRRASWRPNPPRPTIST